MPAESLRWTMACVGVYTSGNTVTLTDNVRTWAEHDGVVGVAWMASGVSGLRDDLDITG
jgi:osmotically-inducible protein OsmY